MLHALGRIKPRMHQSRTSCGNILRSLERCKGGGYPHEGCQKTSNPVRGAVGQRVRAADSALSRQCSTMQHGHVGVAGGSPLQSPSGVRIMDPARHSSPRADFFSTSIRTEAYELQRNWARKVFSISIANLMSTKSHQGVFRPLKGGRQHSLEMYLVAELRPAGSEAVCK